MPTTTRELVYFILGGFFLTNAILAEITGGKLFDISLWGQSLTLSIGVLNWPVVFITTDLINEYYGKRGVRRLTFLAVGMIAYCFLMLYPAIQVPASPYSRVNAEQFGAVFGQSQWIIVGSLIAFVVSQFVDVIIFHAFKRLTGKRMLWLRATGSTAVSQLVDSFIVVYIGVALPAGWSPEQFLRTAGGNYSFKLLVAIVVTPIIYLGHGLIDRFLAEEQPVPGLEATTGEK